MPSSLQTALAALHAQIRACQKCLEAGYGIVPGAVVRGVHTAKIMTIGQAPGPTEAVVKRPFNAGSGQRLFQWLGEAGFDEAAFRASQYMTAVTKCYPGKSSGGQGDRVPSKEEQALCRPWLDAEIALVNPRVIIPLPHPSGASTWHNTVEHQARVKKAIRLIRAQREALGL